MYIYISTPVSGQYTTPVADASSPPPPCYIRDACRRHCAPQNAHPDKCRLAEQALCIFPHGLAVVGVRKRLVRNRLVEKLGQRLPAICELHGEDPLWGDVFADPAVVYGQGFYQITELAVKATNTGSSDNTSIILACRPSLVP